LANFYQILQEFYLGFLLSDSLKLLPPGPNWPSPVAYQFYIGKSLKIFFQTPEPIPIRFHRNVPWVVLFKMPANYDPRAYNGLVFGIIYKFFIRKSLKNYFSETMWPRALIFGM